MGYRQKSDGVIGAAIFDGFVKSPSAALHGNPALLDKRLRIWE
jgi:hypothetical protein